MLERSTTNRQAVYLEDRTMNDKVKIESTTKEYVAFLLTEKIAHYDKTDTAKKDKKYWLSLYCQCWDAANGASIKSVLKEE